MSLAKDTLRWLKEQMDLPDEDIGLGGAPGMIEIAGIQVNLVSDRLSNLSLGATKQRLNNLSSGASAHVDILDDNGEIGAVDLVIEDGRLMVGGRDPKDLNNWLTLPTAIDSLTVAYNPNPDALNVKA